MKHLTKIDANGIPYLAVSVAPSEPSGVAGATPEGCRERCCGDQTLYYHKAIVCGITVGTGVYVPFNARCATTSFPLAINQVLILFGYCFEVLNAPTDTKYLPEPPGNTDPPPSGFAWLPANAILIDATGGLPCSPVGCDSDYCTAPRYYRMSPCGNSLPKQAGQGTPLVAAIEAQPWFAAHGGLAMDAQYDTAGGLMSQCVDFSQAYTLDQFADAEIWPAPNFIPPTEDQDWPSLFGHGCCYNAPPNLDCVQVYALRDGQTPPWQGSGGGGGVGQGLGWTVTTNDFLGPGNPAGEWGRHPGMGCLSGAWNNQDAYLDAIEAALGFDAEQGPWCFGEGQEVAWSFSGTREFFAVPTSTLVSGLVTHTESGTFPVAFSAKPGITPGAVTGTQTYEYIYVGGLTDSDTLTVGRFMLFDPRFAAFQTGATPGADIGTIAAATSARRLIIASVPLTGCAIPSYRNISWSATFSPSGFSGSFGGDEMTTGDDRFSRVEYAWSLAFSGARKCGGCPETTLSMTGDVLTVVRRSRNPADAGTAAEFF
jgi:hypothetical protein